MKKFVIGCLAIVGVFFIVMLAIGVFTALFNPTETTTTTATTTVAEVETMPVTSVTPSQTQQTIPLTSTTPSGTQQTAPTTTSIVTPPAQAALKFDLTIAQSMDMVETIAYGTGNLETIKLSLTSTSSSPLEITIEPGAIFNPTAGSDICSMVVIEEQKVLLESNQASAIVDISTASIDMYLDVPDEGDTLVLNTNTAGGDLRKLLKLSDFLLEPSFRIKQFAVWAITDNPAREDYTSVSYPGLGSNPSDDEIETIRNLFLKAGLDPEKYKAITTAMFVELIDAQNRGLIEVNAAGIGSLESIKLYLTSKSENILEITIQIGTIFDSQSTSIQGMVVIAPKTVILHPYEISVSVSVEAACANMQLDMPDESDSLTLRAALAGGDLMKLLTLPDFQHQTYRVQQFAIWTITDNPTSDGYVGLATGFQIYGTGPSQSEIESIRNLFILAGIDPIQYKVFQ